LAAFIRLGLFAALQPNKGLYHAVRNFWASNRVRYRLVRQLTAKNRSGGS